MKNTLRSWLRHSERYMRTDMVYVFAGNFWLMTGRAFSMASGILLTIAFANFLTPEQFGTYKYILATAGFIGAFSLTGINTAIAKWVAQGQPHIVPALFRINMWWSIPASIVACAGAAYYGFMGNATLAIGLAMIAVTNPFMNSLGISKAVMYGYADFKAQMIYGIPRALIPVCALIGVLFITDNLLIILGTYFLSNLLSAGWLYWTTLKKYSIHDDAASPEVREALVYGKHMSILGFISQINNQIDQLLLWHFAGPAALATYTFALAPIRELRNVGENIFALIFPRFAKKAEHEVKASIPLRSKQLFIFSLFLAATYICGAPLLFHFVFPKYTSAIFASQILALSLLFLPKGVMDVALVTHSKTTVRYVVTVATQLSKIVLLVTLVPFYGMMGAIWAIVLADAFSTIFLYIAYKRF